MRKTIFQAIYFLIFLMLSNKQVYAADIIKSDTIHVSRYAESEWVTRERDSQTEMYRSLGYSSGRTPREYLLIDNAKVVRIEDQDIPEITIDESREVPEYKLVPPPAPTPPTKDVKPEDNRSWTRSPHSKLISETAKKYDLDPQLIHATIMTESEGNIYAFRYEPHIKDASLCMGQILTTTAKGLGYTGKTKDMYKPDVCIDLIGKYHRRTIDAYGELTPVQLAIAYNTGSPFKRPVRGHIFRFQKWYSEEG